jgi:Type IV secretory pathway, TrbL components
MRINIKKCIILLLLVIMFAGLLPSGLFVYVRARAAVNDIFYDNTGYSYTIDVVVPNVGDYTINDDRIYEVTGTSSGIITVASGAKPTIVLNGATRTSASGNTSASRSPLQVMENAIVTLVLAENTTNTFTCNGTGTGYFVPQAGIHVPGTRTQNGTTYQDSTLIIKGPGKLIATGGAYSAGIGGGANQPGGTIIIEGGVIEAATPNGVSSIGTGTSVDNAAGIGGGGGNAGAGGMGGTINISGNATVTAISATNGAGIGGGGTSYGSGTITDTGSGPAGAGGTITITENANVTAISKGNGAGMGGGGSDNSPGISGAGGTITISGDAIVTATSGINGAGIGGGGTNNGTAGEGGVVTISGNPIVFADASRSIAMDIGPGIKNDGTIGTEKDITIISGNVHADRTTTAKNEPAQGSDTVVATIVTVKDAADNPLSAKNLEYTVHGSLIDYQYMATTDEHGKAYIWLPLGSQLIIYRDLGTNEEIASEIINLAARTQTTIPIPKISGYTEVDTVPKTVTWNGTSSLNVIVYAYRRSNEATLTIICVEDKGNEISVQSLTTATGSTHTINAPSLLGYVLANGESSNKTIAITAGNNNVEFKYIAVSASSGSGSKIGGSGSGDNIPETSDDVKIGWWIVSMVGIGTCGIVYFRKKKKADVV